MNFEKMFKMIGFGLIVGLTVLMTVLAPVTATIDPVDRKPLDFVEKPGAITPYDDNTAPVTRIRHLQGWQNEDVLVHLRAGDDNSGVKQTFYRVYDPTVKLVPAFIEGNDFTVSKDGKWKVEYYSVDNDGNVEEVKVSKILIDTVAPQTKFRTPGSEITEETTIQFNGADDFSGIAEFKYTLDGGKSFVSADTLTISEKGIYDVSVFAVDEAGNEGNVVSFTTEFISTSSDDDDDDDDHRPSGSSGGSYIPSNTIYELTEEDLVKGFNVVLKEDDEIKFPVEETEFTLSIDELVEGEKVTFDISGKSISLIQRQSNIFDITNDGVEDIKLIIGTIDDDRVLVTLYKYEKQPEPVVEEEAEDDLPEEAEEPTVAPEEAEETFLGDLSIPLKVGLGSLVLLFIVGLAGFFVFRN